MSILISPAQPKDNAELLALCRLPMEGQISLAMEREPDYFSAAAVQNNEVNVYVCHDSKSGELAGSFSIGKRQLFVNGDLATVKYWSDLRIAPAYQSSLLLFRMIKYVKENNLLTTDEYAQTVVFSDNQKMLELAEKAMGKSLNKTLLPQYHFYSNYETYTVFFSGNKSSENTPHSIRRGTVADLEKMQQLLDAEGKKKQFYPHYDFKQLNTAYYRDIKPEDYFLAFDKNELIGIVGIWDQKKFKQTRVVAYRRPLGTLRPFINLFSSFFNTFKLPPENICLNYFLLHTIIIKNNNPAIFDMLVNHIYHEYKNSAYSYFLCGLDCNDPLSMIFKEYKAKRVIHGKLFLVSFGPDPKLKLSKAPFYMEAARI